MENYPLVYGGAGNNGSRPVHVLLIIDLSQMEKYLLFYPSALAKKTAITLVAHGLNQKPEAMLPLIGCLTSAGSDVYLVRLSGHFIESIVIEQVTASTWRTEMQRGYDKAKKEAMAAFLPLFFVGYSLGALLGQSMIIQNRNKIVFDRQVLLAPATAIRRRSYLLKFFFIFGLGRRVPSFAPKQYRANNSLPLFFYNILFKEERKVLDAGFDGLNIPTLIIIDPKDELISYKKLRSQLIWFNLTNYRILTIGKRENERKHRYRHLVIDEQTLGKKHWQLVTSEIVTFLFKPPH